MAGDGSHTPFKIDLLTGKKHTCTNKWEEENHFNHTFKKEEKIRLQISRKNKTCKVYIGN